MVNYIQNYFPDPSYSGRDIRDWAKKKVPAWKHISGGDKKGIIDDWKKFIVPDVPKRAWDSSKHPRGKGGRFKKEVGKKVDGVIKRIPKQFRNRDSKGRFSKATKSVNGKIKKFLGSRY